MIAAAAASGATLAVGQTERYNPAVAAVLPLVTSPRFIEVHRLGAFPERSLDIDVVFDLMIHDLDIILALVRSEVDVDRGGGRAGADRRSSTSPTRGCGLRHGCIANLTASRISRDACARSASSSPTPTCRSTTPRRRSKAGGWCAGTASGRRSRAVRLPVKQRGAAAARARGFRRRGARAQRLPLVDGEAGRRALALATGDRGQDGERVTGRQRVVLRLALSAVRQTMIRCSTDLNDFIADARRSERELARIDGAGEPRSRDCGGHRSRVEVARRRPGAAVREADRLRHAGRDQPVRLDEAHVPGARRRDARRSRDGDRRADDAEDARPA